MKKPELILTTSSPSVYWDHEETKLEITENWKKYCKHFRNETVYQSTPFYKKQTKNQKSQNDYKWNHENKNLRQCVSDVGFIQGIEKIHVLI